MFSTRRACVLGLAILLLTGAPVLAQEAEARRFDPNDRLDDTPWSMMAFKGWSNYHTLLRTVRFNWDYAGEDMYGLDVAYTLPATTGVSRFFDNLLAARLQVAGKVSARAQPSGEWIPELTAYAVFRWRRLPWNRTVATTLAVGEGVSIVGSVPEVEKITTGEGKTRHFLNYLMFEATFAVPSLPYVQLVGRIHHRSGVFGLFGGATESGSNTVGLGIRVHM
jgi:hypothetical protein